MEDFKISYNELLKRYHNGIKYLEDNPEKFKKWFPELLLIMEDLDRIIKQNNIADENILKGF